MRITRRQLRRIIKEGLGHKLLRENAPPPGSGVRIEDDGYITRVTLIGPEPDPADYDYDPNDYWPEDAEGLEAIEWESGNIASPQLADVSARWGNLEIVDDPQGLADTGIPMSAWLENYIAEFE
mgnify:CR=1 FL=1